MIMVFLVRGMYVAAVGAAIGVGIVWAGTKGFIREQVPSKTGNVIAIILVFAIVFVLLLAWGVGHGG